MTPLFDAQRRDCLGCGGPLTHPVVGRPRRYCDADCAREAKRESDRRHMTPARLEGMRAAKARQVARHAQKSRVVAGKAPPCNVQHEEEAEHE